MNFKISLIIPCFNAAKYLKPCLDSVFNDDFASNIQVIAINDGSADNTAQILDECAKTHSNLLVISQQNAGASVARNKGLEVASGEYIAFLDSDDLLEIGALEALYKSANGADIIIVDYFVLSGDAKSIVKSYDFKADELNQDDFLRHFCTLATHFAVWGKLYKKELITKFNLSFLPGVFVGEDSAFNAMALCHASSIVKSDICVISYSIGDNNGSKSLKAKHFYSAQKASDAINEFAKDFKDKAKYLNALILRLRYEGILNVNRNALNDKHEYNKLLGELCADIKSALKSSGFALLSQRLKAQILFCAIFGAKFYAIAINLMRKLH